MKKITFLLFLFWLGLEVRAESPIITVNGINYEIDEANSQAYVTDNKAISASKGITIADCISYDDKEYPVTKVSKSAFSSNANIKGTLILGKNIQIIEDYAFNGCSELTGSLTIPEAVTKIGIAAFQNCSGMTGTLTLPPSLTLIDEWAFNKCGFTGALKIPEGVTTIPLRAFANCKFNGVLTLAGALTSIGDYAFYNNAFTGNLTLPATLTLIGESAFYNCNFSGDLTIPHSVESLGNSAFRSCPFNGGTLILSKSMTEIPDYCFCYTEFRTVCIPESITSIGKYCFYNYYSRGSGSSQLDYSYITEIICFPSVPPVYGDNAFHSTSIVGSIFITGIKFYFPSWSSNEYDKANGWKSIASGNNSNNRRSSIESLLTLSYDETPKYHYIYSGESADITPRITPDYLAELFVENHFTWEIANGDILEINENNQAIGKEAGITEVTFNLGKKSISSLVGVFPSDGSGGSSKSIDCNVSLVPSEELDLNKFINNGESGKRDDSADEAGSYQWYSSDSDIVSISEDGICTALKFGSCVLNAVSEGKTIFSIQVFVSPTVSIEYSVGNSSYTHHVIYNSTPNLYIAAPEGYAIASVSHDGKDITETVNANNGYYTPSSPITDNTVISVSLNSTSLPGDLNGDGKVDATDLNWLLDQMMNF